MNRSHPVDNASLAGFRVVFSALMLADLWPYWRHDWIASDYIQPLFRFSYFGFEWLKPLPGVGMYVVFAILTVAAVCMLLGLAYRFSAAVFFVGRTYVFLLNELEYQNHLYLICLLSLLLAALPAHRVFSWDTLRKPSLRSATLPAWQLDLLRFQIAVVYVFAGIAKLNGDWLHALPLRLWMPDQTVAWLLSYGGLLLDLFIVPLLLYKPTRLAAFVLGMLFHLTNAGWFGLGVFPWLMIAATALFFEPDWPRRLLRLSPAPAAAPKPASVPVPPFAAALVGTYVLIQCLVPLRHLVYPGSVLWTDEGSRFSWRMKILDKRGPVPVFTASDPDTGETARVPLTDYFTERQSQLIQGNSDRLLQAAHYIARRFREKGHTKAEIRADVWLSLNGRKLQQVIDPAIDLSAQPRTLRSAKWILPLR